MNKLFTKIATLSVGLAMAIGVGVAVGSSGKDVKAVSAADTTVSLDFSSNAYGITTTQGNQTLTGAGATYGFEFAKGDGSGAKYNSSDKYVLFGKAGTYFRNTSAPASSYISAISWTYSGGVSTNVQLSLSYGASALTAESSPITSFGKAAKGDTVSLTPTDTTKSYFFVYVTNAYNCQITSFSVTWSPTGGGTTDSVSVSLSTNSLSIDKYVSTTASLTATATTTGSATAGLSAVSSDTSVATVSTASPTSGTAFTVTGVAVGTATITVKSTWDNTTSATCTVTVSDSTPTPSYDGELAFHFEGADVHGSSTGYSAREADVDSGTTSKISSAHWQITVGNNSAQLGTNANSSNLSKATIGNGSFSAASGIASALGITTTTQKYSAAICTTALSNIYEVDLIFTGTNGGNITQAWVLSSANGTNWEVEATKTSSITTGSSFNFTKNDDARQYAFVAYWNLTNSGGLKGFELKLYGEYPEEQTITASADSGYTDETITLTTNATSANWTITANTAGATISPSTGKTTTITPASAGSVTVQAVATGYTTVSKTVTFSVRPVNPFITPSKVSTSGYTGQNETISFTYGNLNGTLGVQSSNTSAVTVDTPSYSAGTGSVKLNFVGAGNEVPVYFKDGGTTLATLKVTITASTVTITGLPATEDAYIGRTLNLGSTITVTAVGSYTDAVSWESDDDSIATVSSTGVITGVSSGTVDITVTAVSDANVYMTCSVTVDVAPLDTTYVFATNYSTYASTWTTTYGAKSLNGKTDVGGDYNATIALERANKQSSGVGSAEPFLASPKSTTTSPILVFTLNETGYKIKEVVVAFTQRGAATPTFNLYKGNSCSGEALDSAVIGTSNTLEISNLNDVSFSLDCIATNEANNVGAALTSIYISIEAISSFGTLDHITVTGMPNVVYHVGETFSFTGFAVTAFDGVDELTANFKDVTGDVETDLDNPSAFVDGDVPGFDCEVQYSGDGGSDSTSFHVYVYALAEYELVTSEPADWSGQYLIVGSETVEEVTTNYAMNGALSNIDVEGNHKVVSPDGNNIIESGQELEWTISAVSGGYSIQGKSGKYIGSKTDKNNGMLVSDSAITNTISISGSDVTISGTNTYNLSFNSTGNGRFRYYSSGTVKLYRLKVSDKADEFAQLFLGAFTCDNSGENKPTFAWKVENVTRWSWSLLASEYNNLTSVEKEQFRLGVASQTGTNIEQAIARYDYIVGKYFKTGLDTSFTDFMNRNPKAIGSGKVLSEFIGNSNGAALIIIVSTLVSLTAIGGYFLFKKKKQN